jgi:hypothetical protein
MASTIRGNDNFDTAGGNAVKAWVNFNGTGTVAIRASYNVSSITDNGTGDYTVNFTTAMTDANYAVPGTAWSDGVANGIIGVASLTTSGARIKTDTPGIGAADKVQISIAIFR